MASRSPLVDYYNSLPGRNRQAERIEDILSEEEKSSLLSEMARSGLSGLNALSWLLDIPGSAVRGIVGGDVDSALASLDASRERLSGRDLLRKYDLIGDEDTFLNFIGGLAAEVFLDPSAYVSFGAIPLLRKMATTTAGKAAAKAGLSSSARQLAQRSGMGRRMYLRQATPQTLYDDLVSASDDIILGREQSAARKRAADKLASFKQQTADNPELLDQPISKLNQLRLPFYGDLGAVDLFGKGVGDTLARGADFVGDIIADTGPYRSLQKRMNVRALGTGTRAAQNVAGEIYDAKALRKSDDVARVAYEIQPVNDAIKDFNFSFNDPELSAALRSKIEIDRVPQQFQALFEDPRMKRFVDFYKKERIRSQAAARELGIPLDQHKSLHNTGFLRRQAIGFDKEIPQRDATGRLRKPKSLYRMHDAGPLGDITARTRGSRQEYMDLPGGTETFNRLSTDGELLKALQKAKSDEESIRILNAHASNMDIAGPVPKTRDSFYDVFSTPEAYGKAYSDKKLRSLLKDARYNFLNDPDLLDQYKQYRTLERKRDRLLRQQSDIIRQGKRLSGKLTGSPADAANINTFESIDELAAGLSPVTDKLNEAESLLEQFAQSNILPRQVRLAKNARTSQLANLLRDIDSQHASTGVPYFGRNAFQEVQDYVVSRGQAEATADRFYNVLVDHIADNVGNVGSGKTVAVDKALETLGYNKKTASKVINDLLDARSISKHEATVTQEFLDEWRNNLSKAQSPQEVSSLLRLYDKYTSVMKSLVLAWPSRIFRDLYSGLHASAMAGSAGLGSGLVSQRAGLNIGRGNYDLLTKGGLFNKPILETAPAYSKQFLDNPDAALRTFLSDLQGAFPERANIVTDHLLQGTAKRLPTEMFPGQRQVFPGSGFVKGLMPRRDRTWKEFFQRDINPFNVAGSEGNTQFWRKGFDELSQASDDFNRVGAYIEQIKRGADPQEARRIANLTQVDYSPSAFTDFERNVMKRVFPFYSYQKGILPFIAEELIERPAGVMGKTIRTIDRAGDASDENYLPERLRSKAALPLTSEFPIFGTPKDSDARMAISNIDLPYIGTLELLKLKNDSGPLSNVFNTLASSAQGVAGQFNPLPKTLLEGATGLQFYTGRNWDDVYAGPNTPVEKYLLEKFGVKPTSFSQAVNLIPGANRPYGVYKQLQPRRFENDPNEANRGLKALLNAATGIGLTTYNPGESIEREATSRIKDILEKHPQVRSSEHISIAPEDFVNLPRSVLDQYALQQAIVQKRRREAREREKLEQAQSSVLPMSPDFYLRSALPR